MNLHHYRNEWMVAAAFLLMIAAFFYKDAQVSSQAEVLFAMKQEVKEFKEILALKRVWSDKSLSKKVDKLKNIVPVSKVTWSKKGRKLTIKYKSLTSKELNKMMTKLMSLAVRIDELKITGSGEKYHVECKCKW